MNPSVLWRGVLLTLGVAVGLGFGLQTTAAADDSWLPPRPLAPASSPPMGSPSSVASSEDGRVIIASVDRGVFVNNGSGFAGVVDLPRDMVGTKSIALSQDGNRALAVRSDGSAIKAIVGKERATSWIDPPTVVSSGLSFSRVFDVALSDDGTAGVVAWIQQDDDQVVAFVSTTENGGETWGTPLRVSSDSELIDPHMASDTKTGQLVLVWGTSDGMKSSASSDWGGTWAPAVNIPGSKGSIGDLAFSEEGSTIALSWQRTDWQQEPPRSSLYLSVSDDAGASWSEPRKVRMPDRPEPPALPVEPFSGGRIAVSDSGRDITVLWLGMIANQEHLYVSRSDNGGVTWAEPGLFESGSVGQLFFLASSHDGRGLTAVWTGGAQSETFPVIARVSKDGGASWGPRLTIGVPRVGGGLVGAVNAQGGERPAAFWVSEGTLYVANGSAAVLDVNVNGTAYFGDVPRGESVERSLELTNRGNLDLEIFNVLLFDYEAVPPPPFRLVENNCVGEVVAPGQTCTINVAFTPATAGTWIGGLRITNNTWEGPVFVGLQGVGVLTPKITISRSDLAFGSVPIQENSPASSITVANIGSAPYRFAAAPQIGGENASEFFFDPDTCYDTLPPDGTCTVKVTFSPTSKGTKSAKLQFPDGIPGGPHSVNLTAMATAPELSYSPPDFLDFGNQLVGTTSPERFLTVTNTGDAPLIISRGGVYLLHGVNKAYAISSDGCSSKVIAPTESCRVGIVFAPTVFGDPQTALRLDSNDPRPVGQVSLRGWGTLPTPPPQPQPPVNAPVPFPPPAAPPAAVVSPPLPQTSLAVTRTRMKPKKRLALPARTQQGNVLTWTTSTSRVCKVKNGRLRTLAKGTCRLKGSAPATAGYQAYRAKITIKIK